jgi:hypothetical protein
MKTIDLIKNILIFRENKQMYSFLEREILIKEFRKELDNNL